MKHFAPLWFFIIGTSIITFAQDNRRLPQEHAFASLSGNVMLAFDPHQRRVAFWCSEGGFMQTVEPGAIHNLADRVEVTSDCVWNKKKCRFILTLTRWSGERGWRPGHFTLAIQSKNRGSVWESDL